MVLLPQKRAELFHYLQALANPEYQQNAWIEGNFLPEVGHDSFGYVITFFFEDTMLAEAPANNVGTILLTDDEVPLIAAVGEALINILRAHGDACTDAEYISSPYWEAVVNAAAEAVAFYSEQPAN